MLKKLSALLITGVGETLIRSLRIWQCSYEPRHHQSCTHLCLGANLVFRRAKWANAFRSGRTKQTSASSDTM
jgi:hypothetical protein